MECPHLNEAAKLLSSDVKNENQLCDWSCGECKEKTSLWMCMSCGVVNCGRYMNGHAKEHYENEQSHSVCMDCTSYSTYCYACDEFVTNDTTSKHLYQMRQHLQTLIEPPRNYPKRKRLKTNTDENVGKKNGKSSKAHKHFCKTKVAGLRNLGNTCFMNAVLQSLSNIQQFCCYFKQLPVLETKLLRPNGKKSYVTRSNAHNQEEDEILLAEELRKTLILLWQGSKSAISPESLFAVVWKVVPRFRGYQQQDAHEFLRYMLDRLHMELLNILSYAPNNASTTAAAALLLAPKNKSTIVTTIFGGVLQNEVTCLVCGTHSRKHDPFLDLSLDIPQVDSDLPRSSKPKDYVPQAYHLLDCLSSFTELEELTETELYYCHSCKEKQRSTKQFWVRRLPNVLCLHLKRFRWSNYFRIKLDNYVEFPIKDLDMSKFLLENMHETRGSAGGSTLYDLAAVIVHHGSGAGSGHYTAYATHEGCWHHFNDSSVTATDLETVAKSKAYILFYIRREINISPFSL